MARRHAPRAGFLLTETIATFTISAFVLLGLVSASSVLLSAVDRSVAHVQDVDDLSRTIGAIQRDVSSLARVNFDGIGPTAFVFRGGPNVLYFASRMPGPDGLPETRVVALREIVAASGPRLVRTEARLSSTATSFDDLRFGPRRDLATGPARLRFYYIGEPKPGVAETRLKSWPSGLELPTAVLVEAVDAATTRLIVSTRVTLRANADIACLTQGDRGPPGSNPPAPLAGQLPKTDDPSCGSGPPPLLGRGNPL